MGNIILDSYKIKYFDFGIKSESKNIYIQSQIHGNETFSTLVALELINLLCKEKKSNFLGKIRIVPRINPFAWFEYLYNNNGRYNPVNNLDWNRSFNWTNENKDIENSKNRFISDFVFEMIKGFNYIWDLHTPEYGIEHIYTHKFNKENSYFGIQNIVEYGNPTIYSLDESCIRSRIEGKNSDIFDALTIELPSYYHATNNNVIKWANKIYEELVLIGIIKNPKVHPSFLSKYRIGELIDYFSKKSGIVNYYFNIGQFIKINSNLFKIVPFNFEESSIIERAIKSGYPICIRKKNMIHKGDWVVRILNVKYYESTTC